MNASYRLGISIVAGVVALAFAACLATARPRSADPPAGESLGDLGKALGRFRLVERSGRPVTDATLADRPWIVAFVFSRCATSCPVISAKMKGLQKDLAGSGVTLVSLSVDPEYDTPAVLRPFADRYGADPERWLYLTGPKTEVYDLILHRFQDTVEVNDPAAVKEGAELVAHSERLFLVAPGNRVHGTYHSNDPGALRRLVADAIRLDRHHRAEKTGWVLRLPAINASLNGSAAVLLLIGWGLIRAGRVRAHAACMIASIAVSGLFLGCYLVYHYHVGSVPFRGVGPIRVVYLAILLSHTILAVAVVPLILVTVYRAARSQFAQHARIARVTFPVWFYVSVTGVVVYWMLYQMPLTTAYPA